MMKLVNRTERPRILFISEAVSLAHIGRPLMLAGWAREAGYEVFFACAPTMAALVRTEGFEPLPIYTISGNTFYERLNKGSFFYTDMELQKYVSAERAMISKLQPNLVVGDFRLTLSVSTALENVPLLSICNAYWSPQFQGRFPGPNAGFNRRLPTWFRDAMFPLIKPVAFKLFASPLNRLRRQYGLSPLKNLQAHYTAGRWCAYPDLSAMVNVDPIPEGHFFLGPLPWVPKTPKNLKPFSMPTLGSKRPLVYVSGGSSGSASWLPNVLSCLKERGVDVLLSGVEPDRAEAVRKTVGFPLKHWAHTRLLDPRLALERANLTVCHGGSGTVYQSLALGVPVLCVPENLDQQLVTESVIESGAGAGIDSCRTSLRRLQKTIDELLGKPSFRNAARQLASEMAAHKAQNIWRAFLLKEFGEVHAGTAKPACAS